MASTPVLLLQLLLVSLASASSYYGGTMTVKYKGRSKNGTFQVDIRNKATFDGCQYSFSWYCDRGNCGSDLRNQTGVLDKSTNAPKYNRQWCETETVRTRNVPSDKPFQLRPYSCCWISTHNEHHYWRLLTSINLGKRSDTGKPNSSPDIAILPFLRVPQNCKRTYKLMTFDPDGDKVRCRYGTSRQAECGSCSQPSGFFLDQGSCTLNYQYSTADLSGFELVVEDFPQRHINLTYTDGRITYKDPLIVRGKRQYPLVTSVQTSSPVHTTRSWWGQATSTPTTTSQTKWWYTTWWRNNAHQTTTTTATTPTSPRWLRHTTTTQARTTTIPPYTSTTRHLLATSSPLSKLPLQFSFLVDSPAPSCQEGHYLPKFVHPTPENGAHLLAEVNKEMEIKVTAQATHATIVDIIISGPLNISKHSTTRDEFVIRWKPIADDLDNHYVICFAVESVIRAAVTTGQVTHHYAYHYYTTPSSQSGIYQSEMRCVVVDVLKEKGFHGGLDQLWRRRTSLMSTFCGVLSAVFVLQDL